MSKTKRNPVMRSVIEQKRSEPTASPYNFDRPIMLHVCKDGTVSYRDKRLKTKVFNGRALPVFSVDTVEQARQIQVRFCRRQYGAHPQAKPNTGTDEWYMLTVFSGEVEDLDRVAAEFTAFYDEHLAKRITK